MKLKTRQLNANAAAEAWKEQFAGWPAGSGWKHKGHETVYTKLLALGKNPDPDNINKITGNKSWTEVRCDECSEYVEAAVQLGQEPDYASSTATVCVSCLKKALDLATSPQAIIPQKEA
ncbi:hypothetical protein [Rosistilla oblonga]|uniref:hypothetical protein n=1 Tax=Rosistilla oblonga TaxID=2527990 RepID=UPI003A970790